VRLILVVSLAAVAGLAASQQISKRGHAEGAADEIRRLLEQRKSRGVDCSRYH
jgi:hypothetical protein